MSHTKEIKVPPRSTRRVGVVQSDTRDRTRTVAIHYSVKHPKYGKYIRRRTILHVHDQENRSKAGDRVEIAECRPISKTKSWVLLRVLSAGHDLEPASHELDADEAAADQGRDE